LLHLVDSSILLYLIDDARSTKNQDTIYSKLKKTHFENTYYAPVHTKKAHKFSCFQGTLTQAVISSEEMGEPYGGRKRKQASVSCE